MSSERPRILFFAGSLGTGGAERHLVQLVGAMRQLPVDVRLVVGRPGGELEAELPEDLPAIALGPRSSKGALRSAASWKRPLEGTLDDFSPDLLFSLLDHSSVLALCTRDRAPVARVVGIQNALSVKYGRDAGLRHRILGTLVRRSFPRADDLIACSTDAARDAAAFLGISPDRVAAIPNATRPDIEARASEPLDLERPEGPLVVGCGRLVKQKGFEILIEAIAEVRRRRPVSLWIVGEGPERGALEECVRRQGLEESVCLVGFRENPWNAIAGADVFALSSHWEGYGLVLDEAMACGTPIVATDCPHGTRETLEEGRRGLLVPPGDATALAGGIERLLAEPERVTALVAAGRRRFAGLTAPRIAARYYERFERAMRSRA